MKKLFLFLICLASFKAVQSQDFYNSNFTLTTFNHSFSAIRFDHLIYPVPNRRFNLKDIKPGQHFIEIIKYRNNNSGKGKVPVIISSRWISIPPNSMVMAFVDAHNRIIISKISDNYFVNNSGTGCVHACHDCVVMNENEFHKLKQTILSASFESNKLTIARQAISGKMILARQVEELMKEFWFESSKLELAKFAYAYTIDRENYYMVNNSFDFDSSIEELDSYINHS